MQTVLKVHLARRGLPKRGLVDRSGLTHRVEGRLAARKCAAHADRRSVARWSLYEARQQRRFGHIELRSRFSKVTQGCGLDTVEAVAEVHLVEIPLENLPLAELAFEPCGYNHFPQLALQRLLAAQKTLTCHLLRDRAGALASPPVAQIAPHGAGDADEIDAAVFEETLIFDCHDGIDQVRRDP